MPDIIVLQKFKFAHHGYQVEEFEPCDEPRPTTDECAALAVGEGWAKWPPAKSVQAPGAVQASAPSETDKPTAGGRKPKPPVEPLADQ